MAAGTLTTRGWSHAVAPAGSRLLFLDESAITERSEVVLAPPRLEKLGALLTEDSPGDNAGVSAAMGCYIMRLDSGHYRLYYTAFSKQPPLRGIGIAESPDGLRWTKPKLGQLRLEGEDTNRIVVEGLPEGSTLLQPSLVRLPNGRWRMYGWLHRSKPRILRYIAAESTDALHWKAVNVDQPCLLHPLELARLGGWSWLDGPESRKAWPTDAAPFIESKRRRSNDATHTYYSPDTGWEMFSVWALPNRPTSGRYLATDNAPSMLRVIHRRTSDDGLRWSDPELLLTPDSGDAWDQQFYYLAQHRLPELRIGFLGRYRIVTRDMDIELVYSHDGRHWRRPLRGAWLPRGTEGSLDSTMIYMPSHLIDKGDHWLALYSANNNKHHSAVETRRATVHGLRIPRYRFAGLASVESLSARVRTAPFILRGSRLWLDATLTGSLRAELCDAFGRPLESCTFADSVPLTGDSERHELRWTNVSAADYQYDAVSLRLEWTRGAVYGAFGG